MKKSIPGLLIIVLITIIVYVVHDKKDQALTHATAADTLSFVQDSLQNVAAPSKYLYGINIDSLDVVEGVVRRNQNLSHILSEYNVSFATIDLLARNFRDVFDVRKMAANKKYTVLCEQDSMKTAKCFVYEPSPLEYVVFNLKDSMAVYKMMKQVDTVQKSIAGIIDYSLYNTMMETGGSPILTNKLADVFAWQIDFFRIQKNDKFKVVYEELQVEGETVGYGKILGAYFEHFENPYYGVYFDQGNGINYFDEEGQSLQKAFLKAPLNYSRISSRFSNSRFHPVLKRYRPHHGVDYAAPTGTPVQSVGDGVVIKAGYSGGGGHMVKIKHNSIYTTAYLHLSRYGKGIKSGKRVKQGEIIGYVGSTGLSTGPHLDFRFWKHGKPVNPLKVEAPPAEPVKPELLDEYNGVKEQMIQHLDNINFPQPNEVVATL
ncbi:MAG: M23 family metallopeptidase [Candidatus Cyclobacteriaceae bacterium M3_2C_046]